MSIMAKLKAHPYLSILGLGAAALGVDYAVEGDKSIVSSLFRGVFGGGGGKDGGGKGGAHGGHPQVPAGMPQAPAQVAPVMEYLPGYYPAFPAHYHPHWGHGRGHRFHDFDQRGGHEERFAWEGRRRR
jgi:hypothetical protein